MGEILDRIALTVCILAVPGVADADTYFHRFKPGVYGPSTVSFGAVRDAEPATEMVSNIVRANGYKGKSASLSGSAGAGYQLCAQPDCSDRGQSWQSDAMADLPDEFYVRVKAVSGVPGSTVQAILKLGAGNSAFSVTTRAPDTDPDPITDFVATTGVTAGSTQVSVTRKLTGHDGVTVSAAPSGSRVRVCNSATCGDKGDADWTAGPVTAGRDSYVQLQTLASTAGSQKVVTLTYGARTATWTVSSAAGAYVAGLEGFEARCAGGKTGKTCNYAQIRPASTSAFWTTNATKHGNLNPNQWFDFWAGDWNKGAQMFCELLTGNKNGSFYEQYNSSSPNFLVNWPYCASDQQKGACAQNTINAAGDTLTLVQNGASAASVTCAGL